MDLTQRSSQASLGLQDDTSDDSGSTTLRVIANELRDSANILRDFMRSSKTSGPLSEGDQVQNIVEKVSNGSEDSPVLITDHGYPETISDTPSGSTLEDSANGSLSGDKQFQMTTELSPDSSGRSPGYSPTIPNSLLKEQGDGQRLWNDHLQNNSRNFSNTRQTSPVFADQGQPY